MACLLSLEAQAELDRAIAADAEGSRDSVPPRAAPRGSRDPVPPRPAPEDSGDPVPPPPVPPKGGSFFHKQLGIIGVGTVKRGNVKCYHCGLPMPSGTLRFDYAFRFNRPSRSIHTDCLLQIEERAALQNSKAKLLELLEGEISRSEATVCREALATLQRLQ